MLAFVCSQLVRTRSSEQLVEHLVVLVREMRAQHVAREDDLPENLLDVDDFEQTHFVLGGRAPGACSEPMRPVELAVSQSPKDTSGWEEVLWSSKPSGRRSAG